MALAVGLDVYIIFRLMNFRDLTDDKIWEVRMTWLLLGATLWMVSDLLWLLWYKEALTYNGPGTLSDLTWPFSICFVVLAVGPVHYQSDATADAEETGTYEPIGVGPLIIYAVIPLIMHIALYRLTSPEESLRLFREIVTLAFTAILVSLTMTYHRTLRKENRRLAKEETRAREILSHQAFHDELTGLPNRNLFSDRLHLAMAECDRYKTKCAVMFCDLDFFKVVNGSLGHDTGDEALIATAA
jgi:predicted signal transduction protein with EAL and GGDEF domain|tara:strand:- start:1242 stop:1970 length:729 start_codon:yes stop_codon:yes gene_type:complete